MLVIPLLRQLRQEDCLNLYSQKKGGNGGKKEKWKVIDLSQVWWGEGIRAVWVR